MDRLLEDALKNLADNSIKSPEEMEQKSSLPKRIILCASSTLNSLILVFNYFENCLLNTQFMIDNKILIEKIPHYRPERHGCEGDYTIDLAKYLGQFKLKDSSFLP